MTDRDPHYLSELRLFLEEICCELCRYRHVVHDRLEPERVATLREVRLGPPGAFADIKVTPADKPPYFVEIKWGYDDDEFVERLAEKYATRSDLQCGKLIIVTEAIGGDENSDVVQHLKARLDPTLELVFWPETEILRQIPQTTIDDIYPDRPDRAAGAE